MPAKQNISKPPEGMGKWLGFQKMETGYVYAPFIPLLVNGQPIYVRSKYEGRRIGRVIDRLDGGFRYKVWWIGAERTEIPASDCEVIDHLTKYSVVDLRTTSLVEGSPLVRRAAFRWAERMAKGKAAKQRREQQYLEANKPIWERKRER